jgi:hypothetical protein
MLGNKRTIPLWRKRQTHRLAFERALAPGKPKRDTRVEQGVVGARVALRRLEEARRKTRFWDAI